MDISALKPGDRVTSHCKPCNELTSHAIVVFVDGAIHKVECCLCKSVHRYKPAVIEGAKPVRAKRAAGTGTPRAKAVSSGVKKTQMASAKAAQDAEVLRHDWQYALNNTVSTPAPYSMTTVWSMKDVIDHSTFGKGVVIELLPPDKMHVLFYDGARLLKNGMKA